MIYQLTTFGIGLLCLAAQWSLSLRGWKRAVPWSTKTVPPGLGRVGLMIMLLASVNAVNLWPNKVAALFMLLATGVLWVINLALHRWKIHY